MRASSSFFLLFIMNWQIYWKWHPFRDASTYSFFPHQPFTSSSSLVIYHNLCTSTPASTTIIIKEFEAVRERENALKILWARKRSCKKCFLHTCVVKNFFVLPFCLRFAFISTQIINAIISHKKRHFRVYSWMCIFSHITTIRSSSSNISA